MRSSLKVLLAAGAATSCLAGAAQADTSTPEWLRVISETSFDGRSDDLVTGGLGFAAMVKGISPAYVDPLKPTALELRRASLRTTGTAGFGQIWGPTIDASTGEQRPGDGMVAGQEILAVADDGDGRQNVGFLLQVPKSFTREDACLLAVPVGGSASLYRNIGNLGYWGLQRNCAVVYTDKGLGNGFHDLQSNQVVQIDGTVADADVAGQDSLFTADLEDDDRQAFLREAPHRLAFKHAHSRQNPDAGWGRDVLRSIEFALHHLGEGEALSPDETLVIVAGNSNGGGAALYAGEADERGLIDGIVAAQPQVQLTADDRVAVTRGGRTLEGSGRPLLDYFTFALIHQPCAALALPDEPWADRVTFARERCESLIEAGLTEATTPEDAAKVSLAALRDYGWEPESDMLHPSHYVIAPTATAVKYASAQGRFGVEERLCGYSIASVDEEGRPRAVPEDDLAVLFANAPGGPPTGSIDIVNDLDPEGPTRDFVSRSPGTGRQDFNLDGALCLRDLVAGSSDEARRVQDGIAELSGDADLGGKPAIIIHGRADARVPVGFTSRPYLGLNALNDAESNLRYYELTNVEHFGAGLPGYADHFLPIEPYHIDALELMHAHLTQGADLPPSQVVHAAVGTEGEGRGRTGLILPEIAPQPDKGDLILVEAGRITIPH